ncbi:MAG: methionyl-tRNA formyltransferase [Muribaculaceae bacterium]|nr:methionyl-tRNA formyltransferase [Muribaculaceae bacterium]
MEKKDLKIVFFGTPEFAVASLDALLAGGFNVAAVVTMPDKTAGRGHKLIQSDVKKFAVEKGLRVLQPEKLKSPEFVEQLREIDADLFIVIAFRMLPEIVWSMPRLGTFNLHGSLLPKYRGAAPINRAIMNGETETGITTFFLKHEIDTGDMIEQRRINVTPDDDAGTVHDRLMEIGAECVVHTVESILDGSLETRPQPEGEFIPAPKIFKEDCRIDWQKPADDIFNHVRGLSPYPGAWSIMVEEIGKRSDVKIFKVLPSDRRISETPGDVKIIDRRLFVAAGVGSVEILSLQPAGKKRMDASAFILGYHPAKFTDD